MGQKEKETVCEEGGPAHIIRIILGIGFAPTGAASGGAGGLSERISAGIVKELTIGSFKIAKAEVAMANLAGEVLLSKVAAESNSGLLGIEYLSFNFAVLDLGGMALYLRHPDSR